MSREAPPAEPTTNGTAPAVEPSPAAPATGSPPPGRGGQAESSSAPPTGAAPPALTGTPAEPEISAEIKARVLKDLSDDDFKALEPIQRRYNSFLSKEKTRLENETKKQREEAQAYVNWDAHFRQLEANPQALLTELDDPQVAQNYAAIKAWRKNGGLNGNHAAQTQAQVATAMTNNLIAALRQTEEWSHLTDDDIDEIMSGGDVTQSLTRLLMAGTEKQRKQLQAKVSAEIEAGVNEALAKRNLNANGPEPPHGSVVGNGSGGLTLAQYNAMSSKERRALRESDPRAIDAMFTAEQETVGAGPG